MEDVIYTLSGWSIRKTRILGKEYSSLIGEVISHNKYMGNRIIILSQARCIRGKELIFFNGVKYILGDPAIEYEAIFPNARRRFFNSIKK